MKLQLRRRFSPDSGLVHHYSQGTPPEPYEMRSYIAGYELAARQHREGKRIAGELNFWGRLVFMTIAVVCFAVVALTATWVFVG